MMRQNFACYYDVTPGGNFEGKNILNVRIRTHSATGRVSAFDDERRRLVRRAGESG